MPMQRFQAAEKAGLRNLKICDLLMLQLELTDALMLDSRLPSDARETASASKSIAHLLMHHDAIAPILQARQGDLELMFQKKEGML